MPLFKFILKFHTKAYSKKIFKKLKVYVLYITFMDTSRLYSIHTYGYKSTKEILYCSEHYWTAEKIYTEFRRYYWFTMVQRLSPSIKFWRSEERENPFSLRINNELFSENLTLFPYYSWNKRMSLNTFVIKLDWMRLIFKINRFLWKKNHW